MTRFNVYEDDAGEWRWQMTAANGRIIADSGEGYASESNARRAILRLKRLIADAPIFDESGKRYVRLPVLAAGEKDPF